MRASQLHDAQLGELSNHLGAGIGLALIGGLAAGIIIALFTTIPGIVSGNQDVPAAVLAVITASLVSAVAQWLGITLFTLLAWPRIKDRYRGG